LLDISAMKILSTCDAIRNLIAQYKSNNVTIALVPTMGHLHAGHISLVELAKQNADQVIVSIFINPTQFNQASDFDRYPRSLEHDLDRLSNLNIAAVFTPQPDEIYPQGTSNTTKIIIPDLTNTLEGLCRPGHFEGVCTVVSKLFNIVSPDIAVFGEKDIQQLLIIKRMTSDLSYNIKILPGPTLREADGLAMSSRNSLLSEQQRKHAKQIYDVLKLTKDQFSTNKIKSLENNASSFLENNGFRVEYFSIRDAKNLLSISQDTENIAILVAVWLGDTRLIDNLLFPMP